MINLSFIAATFITQVVFMNMLIAIMGEAYNEVMANKGRFALY